MNISVHCPSPDMTFSLGVGDDMTLGAFKVLCHKKVKSIPVANVQLRREGVILKGDNKKLAQLNIVNGDFLTLHHGSSSGPSNTSRGGMPVLDFSSVQVPGTASYQQQRQPQPQGQRRPPSNSPGSAFEDLTDVQAVASQLRNDPSTLALLRERNPALAEALLSGNMTRFGSELGKIRESRATAEMERIRMLNADPMDLDVQRRIAEEIERKNIEENMNLAIENAPESFGQVNMLWINMRVNDHHVKAFVDSGAQMTIMSAECAERCNIMRLVDKRWAGVAKGVGTQKIIGRIHMAQIQIEDIFLPCSFSILENQPMSVLLGLDMLRRHQCVINLRENALVIGTTNTRTYFLGEAEIPSEGKFNPASTSSTVPRASAGGKSTSTATAPDDTATTTTDGTAAVDEKKQAETSAVEHTLKEDTEEDEKMETSTMPAVSSGAAPAAAAAITNVEDEKLGRILEMGFSRDEAENELRECGGDVQNAIDSLLRKKHS